MSPVALSNRTLQDVHFQPCSSAQAGKVSVKTKRASQPLTQTTSVTNTRQLNEHRSIQRSRVCLLHGAQLCPRTSLATAWCMLLLKQDGCSDCVFTIRRKNPTRATKSTAHGQPARISLQKGSAIKRNIWFKQKVHLYSPWYCNTSGKVPFENKVYISFAFSPFLIVFSFSSQFFPCSSSWPVMQRSFAQKYQQLFS